MLRTVGRRVPATTILGATTKIMGAATLSVVNTLTHGILATGPVTRFPNVMPRYLFIGDVHGCIDELRELLDRAELREDDIAVSLGDLVRKGPDPAGCVRLIRERGYRAVRGNNEEKLLHMRGNMVRRLFADAHDKQQLDDDELMDYCASLPLYLDFPEIGVLAVHAGVLPNAESFSPALVPPRTALELRWIHRKKGRWEQGGKIQQSPDEGFLAPMWHGHRTVVYGHTPQPQPRIDPRAIGIDTGCVYGGRLTAALFRGPNDWKLLQVKARRQYAD